MEIRESSARTTASRTEKPEAPKAAATQSKAAESKATSTPAAVKALREDSFTPAPASAPKSASVADAKATATAAAGVDPNGRAQQAETGAEAAARLKNQDNYIGADWKTQRGRDFMETVEAHKNDPAFLQEMYKELGSQMTGELMGDAVRSVRGDNHNEFRTEADATQHFQALAQSLGTMPESFQRDVGLAAAKQSPPEAAMVLKNGAPQAAKLGFIDGVKDAATGDGWNASYAARMAGEVIASDPSLVKYVADNWKGSEVDKLLSNGLESPPFSDSWHSDWPSFKPDGLERMVGMTADLKGPQYADFRARVFRDGSLALENSRAGDQFRKGLVDNLKTLFQSDAQGIVEKLFNNTGLDGPYDSTQKALGLFFRDALFGKPDKNDPFNKFVSDFMADLHGKMLDPSNVNADKDNEYYAKVLGDVLGSVVTGYSLAAKQNGEDQKAREALVSTVVGLAASKIPGGGPIGDAAKGEAEKLVTQLLSDFLNGQLKADKAGMTELMKRLIDLSTTGTRDFDRQNHTNTEGALKDETMWIDFIQQLFNR